MDRIIKAVADETKARGARRVTPSHLYVPSISGNGFKRSQRPKDMLCLWRGITDLGVMQYEPLTHI